MTMILNLPPQLAGGARLQTLDPSWSPPHIPSQPAPDITEPPESDNRHGFLQRAGDAVSANPYSALAHARLAQAAQSANDMGQALQAAERALDLALDDRQVSSAHAAITIVEAYGKGNDLAWLLDDPRAAVLPVNLRLRAALAAGEHAAALGILSDPASEGESSADALSLRTWLHLQRDEYREAVAAGRRAQSAGAAGVALYTNLGYAHAALGDLSKAIKITRQAVALAPANRVAGLNLALYHKLAGDTEKALACLERLGDGARMDVQLALATASVLGYAGDLEQARRVLQRVRASQEWAHADASRRAALEANLSFLRWRTGAANEHTTISSLRRALSASDYRSVSIAYLLCNLLMSAEHAPLLASVLERMQARHAPAELAGMRMLLALLKHDAPATLALAREWSADDVLNPNAASFTTFLISDLTGDFQEAAQLGLCALSRAPSHETLLNNTAYALALAGDPERAGRLLDRVRGAGQERVEIVATRALVALVRGQVERGLDGYRHAWNLALAQHDEPLADRVAANAVLACRRAGLTAPAVLDRALLERLALASRSRPGSWILAERVRRELQIQLPGEEEEEHPDGEAWSQEELRLPVTPECLVLPRTDTPQLGCGKHHRLK